MSNDFFLSRNPSEITETEFQMQRLKKEQKTRKKLNEGTDGIDALDERTEADRFEESREFMRED